MNCQCVLFYAFVILQVQVEDAYEKSIMCQCCLCINFWLNIFCRISHSAVMKGFITHRSGIKDHLNTIQRNLFTYYFMLYTHVCLVRAANTNVCKQNIIMQSLVNLYKAAFVKTFKTYLVN